MHTHSKRLITLIFTLVGILAFSMTVTAQDDNNPLCTPDVLSDIWPETNFCNMNVDLSEIIPVVRPDAIPALTNPQMETVEEAQEWLTDRSPVIVVEIDGEVRAYPQAILMWHEIANDEIADMPVAVTFCPLCNSSIVFDRRFGDNTFEFGVSGMLRNSDLIMYDRQNFTWWQQLTGEAIIGDFAGEFLDIIPSQVIGFGQFAERYPDGLVMSRNTGARRDYGTNPYVELDSNQGGVRNLFTGEYDPRLPQRSRVLAVEFEGIFRAYPFETLSENLVINDTIAEVPVVAFWQPGVTSSLDQYEIDASRDIGTTALFERTLEDGTVLTFSWDEETATVTDDETGSTWNLFGEAIEGELAGTELKQIVAAPHFWFAWAAFHPETEVYGLEID